MKRKKAMIFSFAVITSIILVTTLGLSPSAALPRSPQQETKISDAPTPIPGVIYEGTYLRIGINEGGTFCVYEEDDGDDGVGVGFQYPIGDEFESLASGWWGEGYVVAYKVCVPDLGIWDDRIAYWWPDLGWPPPAECRMVPIASGEYMDDDNRAVFWSKMATVDGALTLTFAFSFAKEQAYVELQTVITNCDKHSLKDVLYKRIVDWDIHRDTDDFWTNDAHSAYASKWSDPVESVIVLSVAGYTNPTNRLGDLIGYVDLFAWDDIGEFGDVTRDPGEWNIQSPDYRLMIDGNAAIYYDLWDLCPGETRNVWTVYQAGWNSEFLGPV